MIGMLLLAAGPLSSPPGTMLGGAPSSRPFGLGCRPSLAAVVSRYVVVLSLMARSTRSSYAISLARPLGVDMNRSRSLVRHSAVCAWPSLDLPNTSLCRHWGQSSENPCS